MPAHDPTGMYRTAMVSDIQYEPDLPIVEGFDYVLRVGERHPMLVLGECLYGYRIHEESVTKRAPQVRWEKVIEVLKRACDRRSVRFEQQFPEFVHYRFGRRPSDLDNNVAAQFVESVLDQRRTGRRWGALKTGLLCSRLHPMDAHYHKALAYGIMPWPVVSWIRGS
jgi:hypothetical protein